jgi:putative nucleotidyltransferase with HDIG domain|tara:strand:+ start:1836 stop:3875 length:2040 start_codon:yes stop_codon:yes gene_type:complete
LKNLYSYFILKQSLFYKLLLFISCSVFVVYIFPRGGQFKYEYQKGKIWQHPTLYAPFNFTILKSEQELAEEKQTIEIQQPKYYRYDSSIYENVILKYNEKFKLVFLENKSSDQLILFGRELINEIYKYGVLPINFQSNNKNLYLIKNTEETSLSFDQLFRLKNLNEFILEETSTSSLNEYNDQYYNLFFDLIQPNIFLDEGFTKQALQASLGDISPTRDYIREGKLIIAQGEIAEGENFLQLESLKKEYMSLNISSRQEYTIIFGYSILISSVFLMLFLFIKNYRPEIYQNNKDLTFIVFNILFLLGFTTLILSFNGDFYYAIPLCILPITIKTFYDARLGLFAHVLTVLLLGFVVPNGFEFVFLQIIAGMVIIQTQTELHKRASIFISVSQIVLVYLLGYFSFSIIHEGSFNSLNINIIVYFIINGLLTLFVQPLIYVFEKLFGLVSDITLLEFSDTNSKLLKQLSEKAPGTFNHSLQVANLAEAAANEIGANSLLVRVGSLYHDIGKINAPTFYSENQNSPVSPHDDLTPEQSAEIIINHVNEGIKIAKKNNIPDRVIDFIRTHHGTNTVYYFYQKAIEQYGKDNVNVKSFKYTGPTPFSKETAILMMADSVEAASKSLRTPTFEKIQDFVNQIIDNHMFGKQFEYSNITLYEIELVKKVLIKRLVNIYHLRIEYPE